MRSCGDVLAQMYLSYLFGYDVKVHPVPFFTVLCRVV